MRRPPGGGCRKNVGGSFKDLPMTSPKVGKFRRGRSRPISIFFLNVECGIAS